MEYALIPRIRHMSIRFQDRKQAGQLLAEKLAHFAGRAEVLVLGVPRGGVVVASEVARRLQAALDAFLVRKLGVPGHEELAMGAVATGGICFVNDNVIRSLGIKREVLDKTIARERRELEQREQIFRIAAPLELVNRVVVLVDDGLATGATMRAAVMAVRERHPARVIVAAPVAARETYNDFTKLADEIVCVQVPEDFEGVGQWYEDFTQTTDEEVRRLLEEGA